MSENADIWTCPQCGMQQDISQLGFFVEIACPQCCAHAWVHALLANYKIDSMLGIGGMSVVFHATDLVLERPVAIKVLNDVCPGDTERAAGFENESALMAKVRHENVVSVYSAGWARGRFYIAMELVEGRNLELIVAERGYLLPADALEIVREVALGLQAAHAAGLLHRDVKPGNVIITTEGKAKVLDFGLALEDKPGSDAGDIIWATPYYAPPETLRREPESVQTDIYALGMTLRNLLTGEAHLPDSPQSIQEMLESKKKLPSIKTLLPHVAPELCELVERMTAYDVAERPSGYEELLELIETTQKVMETALNPVERERRYRRKLYAAAGVLGSTMLGLLGGFIVALMTPSETLQDVLDTDVLRWEDVRLYSEAVKQLENGRYSESARLFAELGEAPVDPAVSAAAMFVRTAYHVLDDKAAENGYRRYQEVVDAAGERVSPAGQPAFDFLVRLTSALRQDTAAAGGMVDNMEPSLIKIAAMILLADQYVQSGQRALAENTIASAMEILDDCGAGTLRELLDEYRMGIPRRTSRVGLVQLHQMYREGDLKHADALALDLLKQKLGRLEKEEVRVLIEASSIMQVALEALHKRGVDVQATNASPERLLQLSSKLPDAGTLPQELACLAYILHGEYNQAFSKNPHAASDSETEPFTVLMRDWKKRLEK